MMHTYKTLALLLVLCGQTGCISLQVRNPDPFSSNRHLPPWKWIQIDRREPQPRGPHLSLSVDRDFVILSYLRDVPPERRDLTVAQLIAPLLREMESELNAFELRSVWSKRLDIALSDEQWPVYSLSDDMKYLLWEQTSAPREALQVLSRRAYWYASVRLAGFSTSYAMRSQSEGFAHPPDSLPAKAQAALRNHPHVPPALVRTHKWTCESGHQHEEFYVIDNGIAWILDPIDVDLGGADIFWFYPDRRDAQEFDPALEDAFASARLKAEGVLKQKGTEGMGSCHAYWGELQTILKEEDEIEWRSPSELNPNTMYD